MLLALKHACGRCKSVTGAGVYLQVIHALFQAGVPNPCASQHCSHLCVLSPGLKAMCKCPSQLLQDEDGLTCSKHKDSSFLLFLSPAAVTQVLLLIPYGQS